MMEEIYEESNEIIAAFLPMVSEEEEFSSEEMFTTETFEEEIVEEEMTEEPTEIAEEAPEEESMKMATSPDNPPSGSGEWFSRLLPVQWQRQ